MKKFFITLICISFLFQTVSVGQIIPVRWRLFEELNKENWQEFYNQSFDYLYNVEYDKAIECLEKARELNPTNPAIYWRLTCVLWWKVQEEQELGWISEESVEMFNEAFNKGVAICESDSANNPEFLFYLGGLYGNRAFFRQALGQGHLSSLSDIKKSCKYLEKIKKTEDFYYEACGYLGIFNYGAIIIPWGLRFLADKFLGYKWDKKQGLRQIKDSMEYGRYSDDIKFLYNGILRMMIEKGKFEDRISEAIELTKDLSKRYPRNWRLKLDLMELRKKEKSRLD